MGIGNAFIANEVHQQGRRIALIDRLIAVIFLMDGPHRVIPVRNGPIMLLLGHTPDELDQWREIDLITGLFCRDASGLVEVFEVVVLQIRLPPPEIAVDQRAVQSLFRRLVLLDLLRCRVVDEQPFTRSLSGVVIPEGVDTVTVEAHDSVHGWGGAAVEVTLPR